jgi:quinol monooxygenase YgiN
VREKKHKKKKKRTETREQMEELVNKWRAQEGTLKGSVLLHTRDECEKY